MKITKKEALEKLAKEKSPFKILFEQGSLSLEIYKPNKVDLQHPHSKDEIYVIISGSGTFLNDVERTSFSAGDILFVKAGLEHRFEEFTDDFSTWVIFFGPEGGEKE